MIANGVFKTAQKQASAIVVAVRIITDRHRIVASYDTSSSYVTLTVAIVVITTIGVVIDNVVITCIMTLVTI